MRPPPLSDAVRHNIVRRLGFIFGASVLVQYGVYVTLVYAMSAAAALSPAAANVGIGTLVLILRIIIALPLGFFAARFTYRALRRAAPQPARMTAQPAVIASAAAASMMILSNLGTAPVMWSTVVRDLLAAGLWIFAAYRALQRAA